MTLAERTTDNNTKNVGYSILVNWLIVNGTLLFGGPGSIFITILIHATCMPRNEVSYYLVAVGWNWLVGNLEKLGWDSTDRNNLSGYVWWLFMFFSGSYLVFRFVLGIQVSKCVWILCVKIEPVKYLMLRFHLVRFPVLFIKFRS